MQPKYLVSELVWAGVRCRVRVQANHRGNVGWSLIDIQVVSPAGHPLPIAESGYHSHQLDEDELAAAGGVGAYYRAWLDRDAAHYRYIKALNVYRQRDLFG